ncbi:sensor histidine kinase [Paenibacillus thalictri]|uniref:HAMP domain-containing protein n=1 Tax=Paenibacillus thalictri TaxID=2527873 RepID=A0A4Q9DCK7_9BACL|nr:histidine kinase [Paenibacillus thalictri]TBL68290.1 HAMP domain-containing protein [Paenibacillus thalictri]
MTLRWLKSLQNKLLFVLVILILPSSVMLLYYNFNAVGVIRNQVAHSNGNLLNMYMGTVDKELEDVDKYLFNLIAKEPDLLALDVPEQNNPELYNLARIRLNNRLWNDVVYYDNIDMFFIYSAVNGDLVSARSQQLTYPEVERLKSEIQSLFPQNGSPAQERKLWFLYPDSSAASLYRLIRYGNVYIGASMNIQQLMLPFASADLGPEGKFVLADADYRPVVSDPAIQQAGILFHPTEDAYSIIGESNPYMVVGKSSQKGAFSVHALIRDDQIMENIPYLRRIVMLIALGTLVVLPIVYFFLRQTVLVPMKRVVSAMRKIKSGDWEVRMDPQASSTEFSLINETFNTMAAQIKKLKIDVYEEQLQNQKSELKHLQLQINPHFFLNALNIIYHLAQVKNFALIQEMSLSLVHYFRYMFRSNMSFVPIRDELEHTRNYLKIQELRFPGKLTSAIFAEEVLASCLVPPLVCQTFVENAIKHAVSMDSSLHITVEVYADSDDPAIMWIVIGDSGKGFHPDVLSKLQSGADLGGDQGTHIGIWNIKRRLRLLYPEESTAMYFSNADVQGARIQIRLPVVYPETMEAEHNVSSIARG